jgi:putative flippase GtrA
LSRVTLKDIFFAIFLSEISLFLISLVVGNILKTGKNEVLLFIMLPFLVFFIMTLGKIFSQRIYEFIKFLVVGLLNTAIDFAVLNLLSFFFNIFSGPLIILFNIVSFLCAVLNSYFLNKYWTFHVKNTNPSKEWLSFAVVSIVSAIASTAVVYLGTTLFKHWGGDYIWLNFIKAIAVIFSTFINFLGYKFFVFKES